VLCSLATADEAEHSRFPVPCPRSRYSRRRYPPQCPHECRTELSISDRCSVHAIRRSVDRRYDGDQTRIARTGYQQVPEERPRSGPYLLPTTFMLREVMVQGVPRVIKDKCAATPTPCTPDQTQTRADPSTRMTQSRNAFTSMRYSSASRSFSGQITVVWSQRRLTLTNAPTPSIRNPIHNATVNRIVIATELCGSAGSLG
jgi:hypothetical protein